VCIERSYDKEEFNGLVKEADAAIIEASFTFPTEVFQPGSRLRWIQVAQAGVNQVLTPELVSAEQLVLTSSKEPMGSLLTEHALMLMLALGRNLRGYIESQANHFWSRRGFEIPFMSQMLGKTIAILGVGTFGGKLAQVCKVGLGMEVLGMSRASRDNPYITLTATFPEVS
jgi:phosphoglycerate dehydrogenase-like enzyme